MKSVLSDVCDGLQYFYGFAPGDHRQINVRIGPSDSFWRAWVGGDRVADQITSAWATKDDAEQAALAWMKAHPVTDDTYPAIQTTGRKAS